MGLLLAAAALALHASKTPCLHAEAYKEAFAHGLSPSFTKPDYVRRLEGLTDTDVQSNALDIALNFTNSSLSGSNTMVVKSLIDGLNQFHVRLDQALTVISVNLDGRPITWTWEDSSHLRLNFDQSYANQQQFTLVINYGGVTNGGGFGSIVWGTHSGAAYCFTLSEPWYAYTWWPNKDDNTDKSLMSIAVTVPSTLSVAANGLLQGIDTVAGNQLKYRYASANPMSPYLLCFGATNFNHFSDTYTYAGGTMPLEYYIWPENDTSGNRTTWKNMNQMMTTLGQWYGLYPFLNEKCGLYQFTFGGGMEHQTMIGVNSFSDNLTVHELGHQWWGDNITCATWSDIWLNEGFADYTEAVWAEKKPGSTGLAALKSAMASRKPSNVNGTVYVNPATDVNRIFSTNFTYYKGGWVLHMLRHVLGDTPFWNGMAFYRNRFALSTATTDDFRVAMQDSTGKDLNQFFQQWIFLPGAPAYQYGYSNLTVNGNRYLALQLKQVQTSTYPIFQMPVDVDVTAGAKTRYVLNNTVGTQYYLIPVSASVTAVAIDPDAWILNTGITSTTYSPGPPKVVTSNPLPGATIPRGTPLTVTFHTPVNITNADVQLVRMSPGPKTVPATITYNSGTQTATINAVLSTGSWKLTLKSTVTAVNSAQALDGELNGNGAAAYPSGDGVAGGDLVIPFTVSGPNFGSGSQSVGG